MLGTILSIATASDAQNMILLNPDFNETQMISGWGAGGTTGISWYAEDDADACHLGSGRSGAIRTVASLNVPLFNSRSTLRADDCFAVQPGQTLRTEIAFRSAVELGSILYTVGRFYDQVDCGGALDIAFSDFSVDSNDWQIHRQSFPVPAGSQSVSIEWQAVLEEGLVAFETFFDRAYVGTQPRIFADDFEAGASCRWSNVVGEVIEEDNEPPTDPGPIVSSSHDGSAAPPPILLSWASSTDLGSGLRTYRAGLANGLGEVACGDLQEIGLTTSGASQDDLPQDSYYAYLCAEDNAGNRSGVVVGGPYVVP